MDKKFQKLAQSSIVRKKYIAILFGTANAALMHKKEKGYQLASSRIYVLQMR